MDYLDRIETIIHLRPRTYSVTSWSSVKVVNLMYYITSTPIEKGWRVEILLY